MKELMKCEIHNLDYEATIYPQIGIITKCPECLKEKKKAKGELKSFNNKPPKEGEINREYLHNFTSGKVYPYGDTEYNIQVKNTAPHAHWIESGHNMVTIDGRTVGFIPGKHILENSAIEFESTFAKDIENKLAKKVIKELEK